MPDVDKPYQPELLSSYGKTVDWPARERMCLMCRATCATGERHVQDGHETINLHSLEQRLKLLRAVWGPLVEKHLFGLSKARANFVRLVLYLAPVFVIGFMDATLLGYYAAIALLVYWIESPSLSLSSGDDDRSHKLKRQRREPLPARDIPALLGVGAPVVGVVVDGPAGRSPLTRKRAVGFAIRLLATDSDDSVMARDSATVGFSIASDDGDTIIVPAGTIEIHGGAVTEHTDGAWLRNYIALLDPRRMDGADDVDPFVFTRCQERLIRVGDRVALHSAYTRSIDASSPTGYREVPRFELTTEGRPVIEVLDG